MSSVSSPRLLRALLSASSFAYGGQLGEPRVLVRLTHCDKSITVFALADTGAVRTLLAYEVAEALGIQGELCNYREVPGSTDVIRVASAEVRLGAQLLSKRGGRAMGLPFSLEPDYYTEATPSHRPPADVMEHGWEHLCILGRQDFFSQFGLLLTEIRPGEGTFLLFDQDQIIPAPSV